MKTRKNRKTVMHKDVLEHYCDIIEVEIIEKGGIDVSFDKTSDTIPNCQSNRQLSVVSDQPTATPICQKRPLMKSTHDGNAAVLEVLEASSFLVNSDWQWTEDGKRLQNKPSPFFLMIWRKNPEALRQQGFELCQESEGGSRVWHVYLHPSDALRRHVSMRPTFVYFFPAV